MYDNFVRGLVLIERRHGGDVESGGTLQGKGEGEACYRGGEFF